MAVLPHDKRNRVIRLGVRSNSFPVIPTKAHTLQNGIDGSERQSYSLPAATDPLPGRTLEALGELHAGAIRDDTRLSQVRHLGWEATFTAAALPSSITTLHQEKRSATAPSANGMLVGRESIWAAELGEQDPRPNVIKKGLVSNSEASALVDLRVCGLGTMLRPSSPAFTTDWFQLYSATD